MVKRFINLINGRAGLHVGDMHMKTSVLTIILMAAVLAGCSVDSAQQDTETKQASLKEPTTTIPTDAEYSLDSARSTLSYGAYKVTGSGHTGTVDISSGSLSRKAGAFVSGDFVIDMDTISDDDRSQGFIDHVKSADFFDVETYPEASFVITSVSENTDGTYSVTGDLTIMDQTNQITIPARFSQAGDDLRATSSFTIDRTRWGINYNSGSIFDGIGDKAIKDEIDFDLDLAFTG